MELSSYKNITKISDEMSLVRNSPNEFYRIWRKKFNGENGNIETFGVRKDYQGTDVTAINFRELYEKLKSDSIFRYIPKHDQKKTNITDAPGFGSVRLSPPYEDASFDKEYFEFLNSMITPDTDVIDYGGGMSPFLSFLSDAKSKTLADKSNVPDVFEQFGILYVDADDFISSVSSGQRNIEKAILFCFHTLEHLNSPEQTIRELCKAGMFVFATPHEEIIDTSIYHHIFMQIDIFKRIFDEIGAIAFLRISKNHPLDIHGVVLRDMKKYNRVKDNEFFKNNFTLYKDIWKQM